MVKVSERQLLRRALSRRFKRAVQFSESSDEEEFAAQRAALDSSRYLARPLPIQRQHSDEDLQKLLEQPLRFFRQQTRCSQPAFLRLLDQIWDDPSFHNLSHFQQRHSGLQLYAYLCCMGHDGTGLCNISIAGQRQMGEGTVSLYVSRVAAAIIKLHPKYVKWPGPEARKIMSARFLLKYGFYSFGILDGTFVYFNQAPAIDPHNFFTRKKKSYGLNCQLICDLDWTIIGYVLGWPGCTPDTQAYETSDFFTESDRFFAAGECLLADKGYTPRLTICVPYNENELVDGLDSTADQKNDYNNGLKKGRLLIERVNAMLKNRFQWLKGMRFQVKKVEDFAKCNELIKALIIVHNFMMSSSIRDVWSDVRTPACDAWKDDLSKEQGRIARSLATATAALKLSQREHELFMRMVRVQQFTTWHEQVLTNSFFA